MSGRAVFPRERLFVHPLPPRDVLSGHVLCLRAVPHVILVDDGFAEVRLELKRKCDV
jgi:hypothetical protein